MVAISDRQHIQLNGNMAFLRFVETKKKIRGKKLSGRNNQKRAQRRIVFGRLRKKMAALGTWIT
jgi:hypothetical protein